MTLVVDGTIFIHTPYGGIARIFKNILPMICDMDPDLRVILFFNKKPRGQYPKHHQISILLLDVVYKLRPWRLWSPYFNQLKSLYLRISICNTRKYIWMSTYFTRPSFNWHGKEVVWIHDSIYELFPEFLPNASDITKTKKIALDAADKIFCNSHTTERDVLKFYPNLERKITVVHLSHDPIFNLRQKTQINQVLVDQFILYVGSRRHYKGFNTLFSAYAGWGGKDDYKLAVVGESWSDDEKELIKQHELENQVILFERISDDELCDLYNEAKAFIYPSLYEGFGIPLLEAMACGCPLIASEIPSTLEIAGDVPIYFTPGSVSSLQIALEICVSENGIQERVNLGLERASQYSWIKTAKTFYAGLQELNERT